MSITWNFADSELIQCEVYHLATLRCFAGTISETQHFIEGCHEVERRWGLPYRQNPFWREYAARLMNTHAHTGGPGLTSTTNGWHKAEDEALKLLKDGATWARRSAIRLWSREVDKLFAARARLGWPQRTPGEYTDRARHLLWDNVQPPSTPPSPPYAPSSPAYTPAQQPVDISDESDSEGDDVFVDFTTSGRPRVTVTARTRSTPSATSGVSSGVSSAATPKRTFEETLGDCYSDDAVDQLEKDILARIKKRKMEIADMATEVPICTVCQDSINADDQAVVPPCKKKSKCVFHAQCFMQLTCRPVPTPYQCASHKCPNCNSVWDKPNGVSMVKGPSMLAVVETHRARV